MQQVSENSQTFANTFLIESNSGETNKSSYYNDICNLNNKMEKIPLKSIQKAIKYIKHCENVIEVLKEKYNKQEDSKVNNLCYYYNVELKEENHFSSEFWEDLEVSLISSINDIDFSRKENRFDLSFTNDFKENLTTIIKKEYKNNLPLTKELISCKENKFGFALLSVIINQALHDLSAPIITEKDTFKQLEVNLADTIGKTVWEIVIETNYKKLVGVEMVDFLNWIFEKEILTEKTLQPLAYQKFEFTYNLFNNEKDNFKKFLNIKQCISDQLAILIIAQKAYKILHFFSRRKIYDNMYKTFSFDLHAFIQPYKKAYIMHIGQENVDYLIKNKIIVLYTEKNEPTRYKIIAKNFEYQAKEILPSFVTPLNKIENTVKQLYMSKEKEIIEFLLPSANAMGTNYYMTGTKKEDSKKTMDNFVNASRFKINRKFALYFFESFETCLLNPTSEHSLYILSELFKFNFKVFKSQVPPELFEAVIKEATDFNGDIIQDFSVYYLTLTNNSPESIIFLKAHAEFLKNLKNKLVSYKVTINCMLKHIYILNRFSSFRYNYQTAAGGREFIITTALNPQAYPLHRCFISLANPKRFEKNDI